MKFCQRCGAQLTDDAAFCPNCGSPAQRANDGYEVVPNQTNGFAIAGLACSFFSPLLGWIFGGIGLNRANRMNGSGRGMSIAAIVIASIMFVISMVISFALASYAAGI